MEKKYTTDTSWKIFFSMCIPPIIFALLPLPPPHPLPSSPNHPENTLCGWQDVKIWELTNPSQSTDLSPSFLYSPDSKRKLQSNTSSSLHPTDSLLPLDKIISYILLYMPEFTTYLFTSDSVTTLHTHSDRICLILTVHASVHNIPVHQWVYHNSPHYQFLPSLW